MRLLAVLFGLAALAAAAPTPHRAFTRWTTTADASKLLQRDGVVQSAAHPLFSTVFEVGSQRAQRIDGVGAALTDASASLLLALKRTDERLYWDTLALLFTRGFTRQGRGVGIEIVRVPISSSDFSFGPYTYQDNSTSADLAQFSMAEAERFILPTLRDILKVNPRLKVLLSPWTHPPWTKDANSFYTGNLLDEYIPTAALYLFKAVVGTGVKVWGLTLQNEPLHGDCDYACMVMTPAQQGAVAQRLRSLLDAAGLDTKILLFDHNWDTVWYPIEAAEAAQGAAAGAGFHCYSDASDIINQTVFYNATGLEVHITECSGGGWAPEFAGNLDFQVRRSTTGRA